VKICCKGHKDEYLDVIDVDLFVFFLELLYTHLHCIDLQQTTPLEPTATLHLTADKQMPSSSYGDSDCVQTVHLSVCLLVTKLQVSFHHDNSAAATEAHTIWHGYEVTLNCLDVC